MSNDEPALFGRAAPKPKAKAPKPETIADGPAPEDPPYLEGLAEAIQQGLQGTDERWTLVGESGREHFRRSARNAIAFMRELKSKATKKRNDQP